MPRTFGLCPVTVIRFVTISHFKKGGIIWNLKNGQEEAKKRKRNTSNSSVENEVYVSCTEVVEDDAVECYWCSNWQHIK